jgi:MFS family permease
VLLAPRVRFDTRIAGAVAIAAGAIVCALGDSTSTLVVGRAIEGAGMGALLAPITTAGPLLPALALAFGPLAGGVIADQNWWHLYFWAGVPTAVILAALAAAGPQPEPAFPKEPDRRAPLLAAGLLALTILFVQNEPWALVSRDLVEILGIASLALLAALLVDRGVWVICAGALAAFSFLLPQYFELAHLMQPLHSGARLSALTIAALIGGAVGWRLRAVVSAWMLVIAAGAATWVGLVVLSGIDPKTGSLELAAGLVWVGGSLGIAAGAAYANSIDDLIAAAAPGVTLILAVTGAVFQQQQADQRALAHSFQGSLSSGVGEALTTLALLVVLCAGINVASLRRASSAARPAAES